MSAYLPSLREKEEAYYGRRDQRERELVRIENSIHDEYDCAEYHRASDTWSMLFPSVFYARIMAGVESTAYEIAVRTEAREIFEANPIF